MKSLIYCRVSPYVFVVQWRPSIVCLLWLFHTYQLGNVCVTLDFSTNTATAAPTIRSRPCNIRYLQICPLLSWDVAQMLIQIHLPHGPLQLLSLPQALHLPPDLCSESAPVQTQFLFSIHYSGSLLQLPPSLKTAMQARPWSNQTLLWNGSALLSLDGWPQGQSTDTVITYLGEGSVFSPKVLEWTAC